MAIQFQKATKYQLKARIALLGPAGSGKSYTAMRLAFALAGENGKVAAIDTEHRSLSKYVGENPDGRPWDFDVLELDTFAPEMYIEGIKAAEAAGYDVLVIDSLSHAWAGKDGLLEFVDQTAKKMAARSGGRENSFAAWREATPKHNELVETMLASKLHLIVTMRTKMEYVQEKNERTGKTEIRKVGLQPIQRDGLEYEFDVIGDMGIEGNTLMISKSRCPALTDKLFEKPGPEVVEIIRQWLESGVEAPERPQVTQEEKPKATYQQAKATSESGNGDGQKSSAFKWTKAEVSAFRKFLDEHDLTEEQAREIVSKRLGLEQTAARFSDLPLTRMDIINILIDAIKEAADPAPQVVEEAF